MTATWELRQGDCVERMRELDDCSIDAVVCDPPYSLGFMGRTWDSHDEHEDAGFGYYLAGLIDGEGHFRVGSGDRRCEFGMKLRADDEWILRQAIAFIRHGRIAREPARAGSAPQAKLIVDTKDGCAALCALLMRYPLRAKKLRDFLTWAEAVDEWLSLPRGNRWHGPADRARLTELGQRIREGRDYSEVPWSGNAFQDWCRAWASEALRVLKPGGHLLVFGGTRTYHRLACGVEDAGFELRDCIQWLFGSGFPKSLDVSKAIDKAAGVEREVIGEKCSPDGVPYSALHGERSGRTGGGIMGEPCEVDRASELVTAPATPEAECWQGWGTALKPAHEPIVVARKPLAGTVAANVLEHGTGALNVDGCRVATTDKLGGGAEKDIQADKPEGWDRPWRSDPDAQAAHAERVRANVEKAEAVGRWPANVTLDEEAAAQLDEQSGTLTSGASPTRRGSDKFRTAYGDFDGQSECEPARGAESGGASRFFYCAKASRTERNAGLEGFEERSSGTMEDDGYNWERERERGRQPRDTKARNHHPTVKPIALMRWLVRLVTPPKGVVLDPFAGSGTTGCAAVLEGFDFLGLEREAEYSAIARARIAYWADPKTHELRLAEAEREQRSAEAEEAGEPFQLDLLAGESAA